MSLGHDGEKSREVPELLSGREAGDEAWPQPGDLPDVVRHRAEGVWRPAEFFTYISGAAMVYVDKGTIAAMGTKFDRREVFGGHYSLTQGEDNVVAVVAEWGMGNDGEVYEYVGPVAGLPTERPEERLWEFNTPVSGSVRDYSGGLVEDYAGSNYPAGANVPPYVANAPVRGGGGLTPIPTPKSYPGNRNGSTPSRATIPHEGVGVWARLVRRVALVEWEDGAWKAPQQYCTKPLHIWKNPKDWVPMDGWWVGAPGSWARQTTL